MHKAVYPLTETHGVPGLMLPFILAQLSVHNASLVKRPIHKAGLAVDELPLHRPEIAAVAGDGAMVPHDKVLAFGDGYFILGPVIGVTRRHVGFGQRPVIHEDLPTINAEMVSRHRDNPLDVALGWITRIVEYDDVTVVHIAHVVRQLVDEEPVLVLQHGHHTGAFYADRLVQEQDNEDGHSDRRKYVAQPPKRCTRRCTVHHFTRV